MGLIGFDHELCSLFGARKDHRLSNGLFVLRKFCDFRDGVEDGVEFGFRNMEGPLGRAGCFGSHENLCGRRSFFENAGCDALRVLDILRQEGPEFDAKAALDGLDFRVLGLLVREVLVGILKSIDVKNKMRSVKLGFKFFLWPGQRDNYRHTTNSYHLIMEIFAECPEFKAMWRLLDEMIENGLATTAWTFNVYVCTCGKRGKVVEKFIKSKTLTIGCLDIPTL